MINQPSHYPTVGRIENQWNDRERQAKAQYYLAQDQRPGGIEPQGNYDEGGRHGCQAPGPHRDLSMDESLHNDLARHGSHSR